MTRRSATDKEASDLRASEATLRSAFRASPGSILITSLPDGRLVDFNDGFTRWTGHRRQDIVGRTTLDLKLWARLEDREHFLSLAEADGRVREFEVELRLRSGELRQCVVSAEVISTPQEQCLVSVIRDISEQKRAQEILRVSEEKFSKAFRASPDAILITSIADGKIADLNEGFSRISGWSRDEVIGLTAYDINLWVDFAERDRLTEALMRDGRVRERACDFHMKSGEVRHFLIWVEVIEIAGQPHILTVARDVTERRKAEAERAAFVRELEAKAGELERFTYTVSHDLKSPLVTIRGFLGLLEQAAERGDRQQMSKDIERIKNASDTMYRLLDELLELSRVGHLVHPVENVDVSELAHQAAEQLAGAIHENGVQLEIQPDLPTITGDPTRLLEVLQNLIENAIKFTASQPQPRVEVGVRDADGERIFFVRDNGIGIDPKYQTKVFELFQRLDQSIEGTGVGLALVKRIVEVSGGRIWVESEGLGLGSSFCFTLAEAEFSAG